jgi:hypothetical protein
MRNVANPHSRFEAAALIEAMNTRVWSAALQQDVMAIPRPSLGKGGFHDRSAMPLAVEFGMGQDIFEECVSAPLRKRFGAVINMQVAAILEPTSETKTATPLRVSISVQMLSARSYGSAIALTSDTRKRASIPARSDG